MQIDDHAARQIKVHNEGQTVARVKSAGADMQSQLGRLERPAGPLHGSEEDGRGRVRRPGETARLFP